MINHHNNQCWEAIFLSVPPADDPQWPPTDYCHILLESQVVQPGGDHVNRWMKIMMTLLNCAMRNAHGYSVQCKMVIHLWEVWVGWPSLGFALGPINDVRIPTGRWIVIVIVIDIVIQEVDSLIFHMFRDIPFLVGVGVRLKT